MKLFSSFRFLSVAALAVLAFSSCTSASRKTEPASAAVAGPADGKALKAAIDDEAETDPTAVADPLEPLNRATFTLNHGLYTFVLRPISRTYETILPQPVRKGIDNAFDNVRFPIRVVNHTLQGRFDRAGRETGKFVVNTVVGVGGLGRPSDHIPVLADVPAADTGQTFAKWGVGHGLYLVLPLLGPSSARDTVGLAGDYALNPITWVTFWFGGYDWIIAIPASNTVRALPGQLTVYDAATKDALDRYLAARSSYIQYRTEAARR